ncbi:MAG: GNAT family N-acetyltransferase, partial [Pleomorphochaeta sp.]
MNFLEMNIDDYDEMYKLWSNTEGMGLRSLDDSKEGISKFLNRNPNTNFICRINNKLVGAILC